MKTRLSTVNNYLIKNSEFLYVIETVPAVYSCGMVRVICFVHFYFNQTTCSMFNDRIRITNAPVALRQHLQDLLRPS